MRNSQASVLAPTGTIALALDCDTTGIEPDLALTKAKKLVGGGTMLIVNQTVPRALRRLGYSGEQVDQIVAYINEHKSIVGAPGFNPEHLPVFACSMGDNTIHYMGHITMMGAVQPFISGAISKTCNVPEETTVDELEQVHIDAWHLGLKAIAIYRDNCKVAQPLATQKKETAGTPAEAAERLVEHVITVEKPVRRKLPKKRDSKTFSFRVADCHGYVTVGEFEDGQPGELFLKVAKQGSTLAGIMDGFAIAVSLGLQFGVPLRTFVEKFTNVRFEPAGMTDDRELRFATSLLDYIFRRLAVEYLPVDERREIGVLTVDERVQPTLPGVEEASTENHPGSTRCRSRSRRRNRRSRRRPRARCRPRSRARPSSATSAATSCSGRAAATPAPAAAPPAAARSARGLPTAAQSRSLRRRQQEDQPRLSEKTSTGVAKPLRARRPAGSKAKAWSTSSFSARRLASAETRISRGTAMSARRAARFTSTP